MASIASIGDSGNGAMDTIISDSNHFRLTGEHFRQSVAIPDRTAMEYADLHHLTTLPESIKKFKLKSFSLLGLEQALQQRINQHTSRDSDRFRQILKLFKEQTKRGDTDEDTALMGINRSQFATILALLGLFATVDQANALFDKYDTNGDGALTVHEFLTRCRPADYVGARWHDAEGDVRGRKMFDGGAAASITGGVPVPRPLNSRPSARFARRAPPTPTDSLYHMTVDRLAAKLREKIRIRGASGTTLSGPRCRREFAKNFEYYDPERTSTVTDDGLRRTLDDIGFPLGTAHRDMLMSQFGSGDGRMNYVQFIQFVFPNDNCSTSLILGNIGDGDVERESVSTSRDLPAPSSMSYSGALGGSVAIPTLSFDKYEPRAPAGIATTRPVSRHPSSITPRPPAAAASVTSHASRSAPLSWDSKEPTRSIPTGTLGASWAPRLPYNVSSNGSMSARGSAQLPAVVTLGGRTFVRAAAASPSSASAGNTAAFERRPLPLPPSMSSSGAMTARVPAGVVNAQGVSPRGYAYI